MSARNIISRGAARLSEAFGGGNLAVDAAAGLTLAAVAIPEQMATARLGHLPPEFGFLAFLAGTVGFLVLGASRTVSVGADSTITPIFAASLSLVAGAASSAFEMLAAVLAIMTGLVVGLAGFCRLGWISNLLSAPVTSGFMAGIAAHILASQLPVLFGIPSGAGETLSRLAGFANELGSVNGYATAIGFGVFAVTATVERLNRKWPGALIGVAAATLATVLLGLEQHGVKVLGAVAAPIPHLPGSWPSIDDFARLAPLSLVLAIVIMVQSAATTRSFSVNPDMLSEIDRDFVGVGFGNILSGIAGAFPVNASPPRSAITAEAGARSKMAGLVAAIAVALLACFGSALLEHIPQSALAGVLLFVAMRIVPVRVAQDVWRQSKPEFALVVATALAIVVLPIQTGVATGIVLSLLHGMWTTTRARVISLARVPGTSIWWPSADHSPVAETHGVLVLAFQAPLSFLNAEFFRREFADSLARAPRPLRLVVLEASNIVEIDFTAAHMLADAIRACQEKGISLAIARLESVRAQASFRRFGLIDLVNSAHIYRSVYEAVEALAPEQGETANH